MSQVSEFAAKQAAHQERIDAAVTGVSGDVTALNELIVQLQSTQGQITAEDQALLDQIETKGAAVAERIEALDALTPPKPPTP